MVGLVVDLQQVERLGVCRVQQHSVRRGPTGDAHIGDARTDAVEEALPRTGRACGADSDGVENAEEVLAGPRSRHDLILQLGEQVIAEVLDGAPWP